MELARRQLAGEQRRNPRPGVKANRAVLMIDPFPGESGRTSEVEPPQDLFGLMLALFGALQNQARFKPDELVLAGEEENYSRFLIAPRREEAEHALAGGGLGGFSGFLSLGFRRHDYFLGRRNAQKFFKDYFVLPENNLLFAAWGNDEKDAFCVRDATDQPVERTCSGESRRLLPIIPLVGDAVAECELPAWPEYGSRDFDLLAGRVEKRVGLVLDRLVEQYTKDQRWYIHWLTKGLVRTRKGILAKLATETIDRELAHMGLMRRSQVV